MSMFAEMTLQELNALAERQRRQIEDQEKNLQAKQKKLTLLTQQSQQSSASDDRLRKLRERAMEQETRLKQFRISTDQPQNTALLSAELTSVRNLLESKQRELTQSMMKVDKITQALADLQKTQESSSSNEIDKLNRELGALHNLNSEQSKKLQNQRDLLRRKQGESAELDRKILDLADRINKKRMTQNKTNSGQLYTNVAPVKPVIQSQEDIQYNNMPTKQLNSISQRHEMPPGGEQTRRDVKLPFVEGKSRNQRNIPFQLDESHSRNSSEDPTFKFRPSGKQDQIFQYRNPPSKEDRPPPPSYHSAVNSNRRILPGQPRGCASQDSKVVFDEWRKRIANHPRPLKKRSSFSEAEGANGPNVQRLLYQQLYKRSDPLFHDPRNPDGIMTHGMTNLGITTLGIQPEEEEESSEGCGSLEQKNRKNKLEPNPPKQKVAEVTRRYEQHDIAEVDEQSDGPIITKISPSHHRNVRNGILKAKNAPNNCTRRVKFDPLALLLDASLEGEIDLVKKVIDKVPNPSSANDEGITALHNSVCAGHFDVVRFLVHWGVDINAADSDGWTPLHCAASCNSIQMVRFLVENGAQIFAETFSDNETAAEKCEELDEGYGLCSDYLYGIQEKLGSVNKGCVYALFDYDAQNKDEISFQEGDLLSVQRKNENGDEHWWLGRHSSTGKEGYVPRNYLGMWPRIKASDQTDNT